MYHIVLMSKKIMKYNTCQSLLDNAPIQVVGCIIQKRYLQTSLQSPQSSSNISKIRALSRIFSPTFHDTFFDVVFTNYNLFRTEFNYRLLYIEFFLRSGSSHILNKIEFISTLSKFQYLQRWSYFTIHFGFFEFVQNNCKKRINHSIKKNIKDKNF